MSKKPSFEGLQGCESTASAFQRATPLPQSYMGEVFALLRGSNYPEGSDLEPNYTPYFSRSHEPALVSTPGGERRIDEELDGEFESYMSVKLGLLEGTLKYVPVAYVRPAGQTKATHEGCSGEKKAFPSFIEMLWDTEGYKNVDTSLGLSPHELRIVGKDGVRCFYGEQMFARMALLPPSVCGEAFGREQVVWHSVEAGLTFVVTEETFLRSLKGSTTGGHQRHLSQLRGECELKITVRGELRNRVFWSGVSLVETFMRNIAETTDGDVKRFWVELRILVIQSMLMTGRCRNHTTEMIKNALEEIVNDESENPLTLSWRARFTEEDLAQLYKLRKVLPKDDYETIKNCEAAIGRFCVQPTDFSDEKALSGLEEICRRLRLFLKNSAFERKASWLRPSALHQGSAGMFFSRKDGGRSGEMHMIVGLHRLSKGKTSRLTAVFGEPPEPSRDILPQLLQDALDREKEIVEACEWFLDVWNSYDLPAYYMSIRPEREAKSRTFCMFHFASQLAGHAVAAPLVAFMKTQEETREVFLGQGSRIKADEKILESLSRGDFLGSADASTSTDSLMFAPIQRILNELEGYVPDFCMKEVRRIFRPQKVGVMSKRKPGHPLGFFEVARTLFERTGGYVERTSLEPRALVNDSVVEIVVRDVPNVRLKPHLREIVEALQNHRRVLLKCSTGSGKTVLGASMMPSIIQFPSIAALELFAQTCENLQINYARHYSAKKETPEEDDTILTTASFIVQLARKFPKRLVVLDEAEMFSEDHILNLYDSKTITNRVLITSATPEALHLEDDIAVLKLTAPSPYEVLEQEIDESELLKVLEFCNKSLICAHSEPWCHKISARIENKKVLVLDSSTRAQDVRALIAEAEVILSTNVIRSSVTIEGLTDVFDLGGQYLEIDFPSSGFRSLTLMEVTQEQRTQLRGRVGRVGPGTYWKVRPRTPGLPLPEVLPMRFPGMAARLQSLRLDELPHKVSLASLAVEAFGQSIIMRTFECSYPKGEPLSVSAIRKGLPLDSKFVAQAILFDEMGLFARVLSLKSEEKLQQVFQESKLNFVDDVSRVLDEMRSLPGFQQNLLLIDKWTASMSSERAFVRLEDNPAVQLVAGVILWRSVARRQGNQYIGVHRNFSVRAQESDVLEGAAVVLVGLAAFNGRAGYVTLLRLSERVFEIVTKLFLDETVVFVPESASCNLHYLTPRIVPKEVDGRQMRLFEIRREDEEEHTLMRPHDLPKILKSLINRHLSMREPGTEVRLTSRGCPQSHAISFPFLNLVNLCAMTGVKLSRPDWWSFGYGDDLLCGGAKEAFAEVLSAREAFGLLTNASGTGITKTNTKGIAVFCEILWSTSNGARLMAIKPRSAVNLQAALRPNSLMHESAYYVSDMRPLESVVRNYYPEYMAQIEAQENEEVDERIPVRWTLPRSLAQATLEARDHFETRLHHSCEEEVLKLVEFLYLTLVPSTKHAPKRALSDVAKAKSGFSMRAASILLSATTRLQDDHPLKLRFPEIYPESEVEVMVATGDPSGVPNGDSEEQA